MRTFGQSAIQSGKTACALGVLYEMMGQERYNEWHAETFKGRRWYMADELVEQIALREIERLDKDDPRRDLEAVQ